jgi:DUF2934 family protein
MMKKHIPAKAPKDLCGATHEQQLKTSGNGTWYLIAMKAYELYEQRGREDGYALEDWIKAEALVHGTSK